MKNLVVAAALLSAVSTPALAWIPCTIGKPCVLAVRQPPVAGNEDRRDFFWGTAVAYENNFIALTNVSYLVISTPPQWTIDKAIDGVTPPDLVRLTDPLNIHITDSVVWSGTAKRLP